jgi:hypothetical protein
MEQTSLPLKTKIAAWWMIVISGLMILYCLWGASDVLFGGGLQSSDFLGELIGLIALIFLIIALPVGLVFFIPSIFLLKKKRKPWWFIEIILFISIIVFLINFIFPILIIFVPPFILLLIDRKNFWKVAT